MKADALLKLKCKEFYVQFDKKGNIHEIVSRDKKFQSPMNYTFYEINGQIAESSDLESQEELSLKLRTKDVSGKLAMSSDREAKIHFEPEKAAPVIAKNLGLVLSFSLETEFHLPECYNLGRRIDDTMPVGEWYSTSLGYNFFLANVNGMWLRFMTKQLRLRGASIHISRHPEMFIVTFTWNAVADAFIGVFRSMDEALEDLETWFAKDLAIKRLQDNPSVPSWIHNVKLVFIIDIMRSNWEIAHDYNDVTRLAKELGETVCPKDTLFYIPGWNGAYDSTYPTFRPHPDLGGENSFKEMMDTLHEYGFRVMIHTNAWGVDPCHPDIDKLQEYVRKDDEGYYQGWQTGRKIQAWGVMAPQSRPLKFLTDKISFVGPNGAKSFTFETVSVPDTCEALVTIGGLKVGDARVKFTIDRRIVATPTGWFKDHEKYALPFPFLMKPGKNKVHVEVLGDTEPNWSKSWYQIRYSFVPFNPYVSWSYPILLADISNPEWIRIFVDEVASVVNKYKIDAIHVDATEYYHSKPILDTLKERLPHVAMGGEGVESLEDLGYWAFCQNARQSMLGYLDTMQGTSQQGSLSDRSEIEELYSWLDKPSPVCRFINNYVYFYPHLCAADAFVPIGKVCNTYPTRFSPRCKKELWKVTRDAKRLNYIPGLRLNYHKHGLDEETKRAIQEIAQA